MLHWAVFSIVGKLVGYRRCVASSVACFALMTPKIKWLLLAEIQSSAVQGLYSQHTCCMTHFYAFGHLFFCDLPKTRILYNPGL